MKKLFAILLAVCLLLALSACGVKDIVEETVTEVEEAPVDEPEAVTEETPVAEEAPVKEQEAPAETTDGIRPDFKAAMDSYEAFYNEYCDFMKKYMENPTDLTLLTEYADMMSKSLEVSQDFEAWNEAEMNDAELNYYLEVSNRVAQKLLEVAQ